ncbi:MAG: Hsp20 family protein [candidate division Zixibacteria bacterium]|nr:Hsp20 family protein [candidate division Zixibacteria bacterium]
MALVKFRKRNQLEPWDMMNTMFRNFFNEEDWPGLSSQWAPVVDVSENSDKVIVRAEVPGMTKEDIKVTVSDGTLTLTGDKKQEKIDKEENYYRSERSFGSFARTFSLPSTINADKIKAQYKDGVLTVHMPKVEEAKPKQIEIS